MSIFGLEFENDIVIFEISTLEFVYLKNFVKKQKCLIWVFLGSNFKELLSYLKSAPSNLSNCNISWKNENAEIWYRKYLIWVFLGLNFEKLLSYLKSAPSNLSNCKTSQKKIKTPKFGTKSDLFGYFWVRILKHYCHI